MLSTLFANRTSSNPDSLATPVIMNGAGTVRTLEEVRRLADSDVNVITVGSMCLEERAGNPGDTFALEDDLSLNSRGLPDRGVDYWKRVLPEMAAIAHDHGKLLSVSVAGMTPIEFGTLTHAALEGGADIVEENFGCPNVWKDGAQKRILSFAHEARSKALWYIQSVSGTDKPVVIKVSPFSDPVEIPIFANDIRAFPAVRGVVTMNTFPNAYLVKSDGRPRIDPKFGGLAGPAVKAIALGQVLQWRNVLPPEIAVIGVGGIRNGQDMHDFVHAGATAVQVVTEYLRTERPDVFTRILSEYIELSIT